MAKIAEYLQVGNRDTMTVEQLLRLVEQLYRDIAVQLNRKCDLVQRSVDGQVGDVFLDQGTININLSTDKVEILTNHNTSTTVTWKTLHILNPL